MTLDLFYRVGLATQWAGRNLIKRPFGKSLIFVFGDWTFPHIENEPYHKWSKRWTAHNKRVDTAALGVLTFLIIAGIIAVAFFSFK